MITDPETTKAGTTRTEQLLFDLCSRSFLRLWSYANPFKDDGDEFCDVLVVFENHVLIFFDREKPFTSPETNEAYLVAWERWKRRAVEAQIRTAHGAERYLRSGRALYLDAKKEKAFPQALNINSLVTHKIIVAHGVAEACKQASPSNISGSLAINYADEENEKLPSWPFMVSLSSSKPVHVLCSESLPIILRELDTISDFTAYLDTKKRLISRLAGLSYCAEEDLLGNYLLNIDEKQNHYIGTTDKSINFIVIEEGTWEYVKSRPAYALTKEANKSSYIWDNIIDRTCNNFLKGILLGNNNLFTQRSAIHEMAKEPRFMRRTLVELMSGAIQGFTDDKSKMQRHMRFMPSNVEGKGYVFLQLWIPVSWRTTDGQDRQLRQYILEIACCAAKNKMPGLHTIIGIGIDPPKHTSYIAEDFILMDCTTWSEEQREQAETANRGWDFFKSDNLKQFNLTANEFVQPMGDSGDRKDDPHV